MNLRAVVFDVDFTLCRPGPELGPEGYRRLGARHGLDLDPALYPDAREAAIATLKRHPELHHDDEIWVAFTEVIVRTMGGDADGAHECAREMTLMWERCEHFDLYEDALPVLEELRRYDLKLGLISNTGRDLREFAAHHLLDVDAVLASRDHGRTKPDPSIFRAALEELAVEPGHAVMVGDSLEDDVDGARAVGMQAILVDREDRHPGVEPRLHDLYGLPAALGLVRPGGH